MPLERNDADLLDLALRMDLVTVDAAAQFRQQFEEQGRLPDAVWNSLGLSAEDRVHLSYVAERIQTVVEGRDPGNALHATRPAAHADGTTATMTPRSVGRYRIERLIASGGMGRVWSAFDETLQRSVALKDIRPDVREDDAKRRFIDEAKITARLEHPGIIPVYDMPAGDGGPTYVMRFVRGKTFARAIGEHHHRRRSGAADAIEFFQLLQAYRSVCQTVAYAHAQNVLHRDLKPANVLLGDFGEVLVLDWGIAKSNSAPTEAPSKPDGQLPGNAAETQAGTLMGTPAYMSPEQASGAPRMLTPRSDVWSLGIILYEILTGQVPFHGDDLKTVLAKVQNETPLSPRTLNPNVPRALEAICHKAMKKSPEDRYASAAELADDVARWLADEPVRAYAEPWWRRAARWGRRHKAIVASSAVLLVAAVLGLSIGTFFIERQRARAEANLKTALDVVDSFFVTVSENRLLNEPGMQPLRAELLRSAVAFSQKFAQENSTDPARQADLARVMLLLGRVLSQLDDKEQARSALEQARDLYGRLQRSDLRLVDPRRGQALATLSLGVLHHAGNPVLAEKSYRDAIEQYKHLQESAPTLAEAQEKLALASNNLGSLQRSRGKFDEAAALFETAIAIMEPLTQSTPKHHAYADHLAGFHANLADVWMQRKNLPETRKHLETSWALRQGLAKRGVKGLDLEESMAASQNHLGNLAMMEGKFAAAEAHFREALALRTALVRRNPDLPKWKASLAWASYSLSRPLEKQGRYPDALAAMDQCIATLRELPAEPINQLDLGRAHLFKGYYLYDSKQLAAADEQFTLAVQNLTAGRKELPEKGVKETVDAYWTRAMVRVDLGQFSEAVADYDRALQLEPGPQREALTQERAAAARKASKK